MDVVCESVKIARFVAFLSLLCLKPTVPSGRRLTPHEQRECVIIGKCTVYS